MAEIIKDLTILVVFLAGTYVWGEISYAEGMEVGKTKVQCERGYEFDRVKPAFTVNP